MSLPPRQPDDSECCGSGCARCVFDIYEEELQIWKRTVDGEDSGVASQDEELQPDVYSDVKIVAIERANHNSFIYTLSSTEGKPLISLKAIQHIILKGYLGNQSICRQYTPLNIGNKVKQLRILIKLYRDGKMSSLVSQWKNGDIIQCRGPLGNNLHYAKNKWEKVILIAAGTGITPMAQIIQTILNDEEEETLITLLFACRRYDEILIKNELDAWSDYWNFSVTYYVSGEQSDAVQRKKMYNDNVLCNRICFSDIKQVANNISKTCAFVCGPYDFEADMQEFLMQVGFSTENIARF